MKKLAKIFIAIAVLGLMALSLLACTTPEESLGKIEGELPEFNAVVGSPYGSQPDLDDVIIDGKLDDGLWENKKWYSSYDTGTRVGLFLTTATSDMGLYVAAYSVDGSVFWTYRNHFESNTNIVVYIRTGSESKSFAFDANNIAPSRYSVNAKTSVGGVVNAIGKAEGLRVEMFITWEELGFESKPESVFILPVYKFKESETRALQTLYPTFQKTLTSGFDEYFEFDGNGFTLGDGEGATVGNHEIGLGKTNVWTVEKVDGEEVVTANGAKRLFGQAIFFKGARGNFFRISATVKARNINSSKTRAGLLIYNNNISYRAAAIELSQDVYSDGKLDKVALYGYTDYPKGTTVTTFLSEVDNKSVLGKADDEADLSVYYDNGNIYYVVNGEFVCAETVDYLNNCYMGLYSFNSSAQFSNLSCQTYGSSEEVREAISDFAYTVDVINYNSSQASVTADKICVPKSGGSDVTFTFACAPGYTVGEFYLEDEDGNQTDLYNRAKSEGGNGAFTLTGIDRDVIVYCEPKEIEEELVSVKAVFYNADYGKNKPLTNVSFTLTGDGSFDRYTSGGFRSDGVYSLSLPKGRAWSYSTEISGFRPSTGDMFGGAKLTEEQAEPQYVAVKQNVIGGVATNQSGDFTVSSNPGTVWDLSSENNDEVYFQTTNNQHTTIYFSGKTVSDYHVAYVEITNQTDPLAFTSLERDPAAGFVVKNARYGEGKAMLRFAGMRIVPDNVWAKKVDTGNIFPGYQGYDVATNKGVMTGEPYLASGGTVNRLSYEGREDVTSLLMIRTGGKMYFYVADGSIKAKPDGSGFDGLTYLYEYENEAFGGEAAVGIGATVSYNLRLKYANYWILSGEEAKSYAKGKITSTLTVNGGELVDMSGSGLYGENGSYTVSANTALTLKAKNLNENEILKVTLGDKVSYIASGEKTDVKIESAHRKYSLRIEKVPAITVSGSVKGYDAKLHAGISGTVYEKGEKVKGFTVKDGKFSFVAPVSDSVAFEVGINQYLSERISLGGYNSDFSVGEVDIIRLPFGGTVKTETETNLGTQNGYEYAYDKDRGAEAHITVNPVTNLVHTLAVQSESMENAILKFSFTRRSTVTAGVSGTDEGALGVGITVTDGRRLRTMLLIRNGYRVLANNNNGTTVEAMNSLINPVDVSAIDVTRIDIMAVKKGNDFYMLSKYSTSDEYSLVFKWTAEENGKAELQGRSNFALTFMAGRGSFVDMTFHSVSIEELTESNIPKALKATVTCNAEGGEITLKSDGLISTSANVYTVYKSSDVELTVIPDEGKVISKILVNGEGVKLDNYAGGSATVTVSVVNDLSVVAEIVGKEEICFVSGKIANYEKAHEGVKGTVIGRSGAIGSFVISDGRFTFTAPTDEELWLEINDGGFLSERVALGSFNVQSASISDVTLYERKFGGSVKTEGGSVIGTQAGYEYGYDKNLGAFAHVRTAQVTNLIHTLALQTESMESAVISFSYSRKSAAECSASGPDEGAMGIGFTVSDGKTLRTMLLIRNGYRVLANNNNGMAVDKINEPVSPVSFAPVSVDRVDVMLIKDGSDFYVLCKAASDSKYSLVFKWTAEAGGVKELGGKCNFAITYMAGRGTFTDMTFFNIEAKTLNKAEFPEIF